MSRTRSQAPIIGQPVSSHSSQPPSTCSNTRSTQMYGSHGRSQVRPTQPGPPPSTAPSTMSRDTRDVYEQFFPGSQPPLQRPPPPFQSAPRYESQEPWSFDAPETGYDRTPSMAPSIHDEPMPPLGLRPPPTSQRPRRPANLNDPPPEDHTGHRSNQPFIDLTRTSGPRSNQPVIDLTRTPTARSTQPATRSSGRPRVEVSITPLSPEVAGTYQSTSEDTSPTINTIPQIEIEKVSDPM